MIWNFLLVCKFFMIFILSVSVLTLICNNWIVVLCSLLDSLFYAKPKTRWEVSDDLECWLNPNKYLSSFIYVCFFFIKFLYCDMSLTSLRNSIFKNRGKVRWYFAIISLFFVYICRIFFVYSLWTFFSSLQFRITH